MSLTSLPMKEVFVPLLYLSLKLFDWNLGLLNLEKRKSPFNHEGACFKGKRKNFFLIKLSFLLVDHYFSL